MKNPDERRTLADHIADRPPCSNGQGPLFSLQRPELSLAIVTVTDGVEGVCVDPGETGAILEAGGVGGPGPPGGGKGGQLASDSGGG
jgi:hypothetical protein